MIFTCEGKIPWETAKWEKSNESRDNLWNQDKIERLERIEKKKEKKKSNKVKD